MNRRRRHPQHIVCLALTAVAALAFILALHLPARNPHLPPPPPRDITTERRAVPRALSNVCPICHQRATLGCTTFRCPVGHRYETPDEDL